MKPPESPRVSIVMPTYNSSAHVEAALRSILQQTYPDYEIIVVDDGSDDNTLDIVRAVAPGARVFKQPHGGAAAARNRGIRESNGEFVAFQDSDDLWHPTKLEKQIAAMDSVPSVGMVMCGHKALTSDGERTSWSGANKSKLLVEGDSVLNIFLNSGVATPSVVVRRAVLDEVGLFEEQLQVGEDENLWLRIAYKFPIESVDEILITVRVHDRSLTGSRQDLAACVEEHLKLLQEKYTGIRERIAAVVPTRMSGIHFGAGEVQFAQGEYERADASFAEGLKWRPGRIKYIAYRALCHSPRVVIDTVKRVWRWYKGTPPQGYPS